MTKAMVALTLLLRSAPSQALRLEAASTAATSGRSASRETEKQNCFFLLLVWCAAVCVVLRPPRARALA
jgi:hypothetical protein